MLVCAAVRMRTERLPSGDGVGACGHGRRCGGSAGIGATQKRGCSAVRHMGPGANGPGVLLFFPRLPKLRHLLTEITFGVIDLVPVAPKH